MSKLFRAVLGIGGAAAAVILSRKGNREKLKAEYDKYKENPESYKQNAKELANQIGSNATETFKEVKQDPKGYASKVKEDPKGFLKEQKARLTDTDSKDEEHIEEARFTDEGAADPSNNLRVITEEELKKNQRNHEEK
ncbi:gas vesicle protein [Staphylococcus auricularis]|uniref:YtxH domain-containing protein n=1 Tax=Staphylococcus auricularis TaxID=29379 RepID=A0AAW7MC17_9STAP|nr:YtxH domain-containing protein [Staphylococcus auricularis]MBM0868145.1 YtxH domain-containing protein [Staphylococcus auricularis]MCG7341664.1 YtxH domain-containing protein [Staphylococcus auricularis]MDC6326965.1 YtxH domain-containing protein [Staphylococcus auricularis]MDN4532842.1 YtxH domain-containing protein [Staphylococcus auricularis]HJE01912.1 YtxH domain-containing protein [Staphylococcus auricularis]